MDELLDTLSLYKFHYPLWFDNSLKEIFYHIYPSLILGQYKVHTDEDGLYGFRNWAFLSEEAEQKYLKTREIDFNDWNSGDRTWVIDTIFKRKHKPQLLIDLAVPRDIEKEVFDLDDVYLYTVDDLGEFIEKGLSLREASLEDAEDILGNGVEK